MDMRQYIWLRVICPTQHLSYPTFVLPSICPTQHLSYPTFVLRHICPTQHLSYLTFVLPDICPSWHFSNLTFVQPDICPTQHLSYPTFVLPDICPANICRTCQRPQAQLTQSQGHAVRAREQPTLHDVNHRFLRKVDLSKHISSQKIHFNMRASSRHKTRQMGRQGSRAARADIPAWTANTFAVATIRNKIHKSEVGLLNT